jgi:hypothetical protein
MQTVGFFFFNNSHHIYHAVSVAFELSKLSQKSVVIYCSSETNLNTVKRLATNYFGPDWKGLGESLNVKLVLPSKFYRVTRYLKRRSFPGINSLVKQYVKEFSSCDVLVSPSDDILMMRSLDEFQGKKFVYTHHGAGDREYGFLDWVTQFDLIFVSSQEIKDRFSEMGIFNHKKNKGMVVIGYPKFDLCLSNECGKKLDIFANNNPVVLYNPHFEEEFSSWYRWGAQLVHIFSSVSEFNFIIAPHISLSNSEKRKLKSLCRGRENIYLDVDATSKNLVDMTYTIYADIYVGDVSSQVYEFLVKSRPCIFLNPNGFKWQSNANFSSWKFGEVVESIADVSNALDQAAFNAKSFKEIQRHAFENRFYQGGAAPSRLGAELISNI